MEGLEVAALQIPTWAREQSSPLPLLVAQRRAELLLLLLLWFIRLSDLSSQSAFQGQGPAVPAHSLALCGYSSHFQNVTVFHSPNQLPRANAFNFFDCSGTPGHLPVVP